MILNKICRKCKIDKPLKEFYKNKGMKNGYVHSCKKCQLEQEKIHREIHKEKYKTYQKEYHKSSKAGIRRRELWHKNKERNCARARQWKKDNPEKVRNLNRKRRDLTMVSEYKFKVEYEALIREQFDNQCFRCHISEEDHQKMKGKSLSIDHFVPLSMGEQLEIGNALLLCSSCNSAKHGKHPYGFFTKQELMELTL